MRQEVIPLGLQDAHFDMNMNNLCQKLLPRYGQFPNLNAKMLDVGGRANNASYYDGEKSFWEMDYHIMNIVGDTHPKFFKSDITHCPEIPDNSFDFIYSSDTFEHISKPWLAAKEITRILKPGGLCYVITLFAWRYHKEPEDYFRYTPFGLISLFDELEACEANWDGKNRRGAPGIGIQGDGTANDVVPVDMLGAWRENWRVFYLGRKNKK